MIIFKQQVIFQTHVIYVTLTRRESTRMSNSASSGAPSLGTASLRYLQTKYKKDLSIDFFPPPQKKKNNNYGIHVPAWLHHGSFHCFRPADGVHQ